jgi:hypothetical protein
MTDQKSITGTMTCVTGDIGKQPDGTQGVVSLTAAQHSKKLVVDERGFVFATHFDDVEEILARDDVFSSPMKKKCGP